MEFKTITPHQLFSLEKDLQHHIHACCLQYLADNSWQHYNRAILEAMEYETLQFLQIRGIDTVKKLQKEIESLKNVENAPTTIKLLEKFVTKNVGSTTLDFIQIEEGAEANKSSQIYTPNNSEAGYNSEASDGAKIIPSAPTMKQYEITLFKQFEHATGVPRLIKSITNEANHTYLLKRSVYTLASITAVVLSMLNLLVLCILLAGGVLLAAGTTRVQDVTLFCTVNDIVCQEWRQVGNLLSSIGLPLLIAAFAIFWVLFGLLIVVIVLALLFNKSRRAVMRDVLVSFYELELIHRYQIMETESNTCIQVSIPTKNMYFQTINI